MINNRCRNPQKSNYRNQLIKNIDGDSLEITDLAENDVISVASDKEEKCINIIVSNEKVTGKASSYDEEIVTIAGKDYAIGLSDNGNKNFTVDRILVLCNRFYTDTGNQTFDYEKIEKSRVRRKNTCLQ